MGEAPATPPADQYTWFSPGRNRIVTTPTAEAPVTPGVNDWTLIGQPETRRD